MSTRSGNKVLRQTHDDAATVGNSLTNNSGSESANGLVQNPFTRQTSALLSEGASSGDRVANVRAGEGFILCASLLTGK